MRAYFVPHQTVIIWPLLAGLLMGGQILFCIEDLGTVLALDLLLLAVGLLVSIEPSQAGNFLLHPSSSQANLLGSSWVFMWDLRCWLFPNDLSHTEHLKDVESMCLALKWPLTANPPLSCLWHNGHSVSSLCTASMMYSILFSDIACMHLCQNPATFPPTGHGSVGIAGFSLWMQENGIWISWRAWLRLHIFING